MWHAEWRISSSNVDMRSENCCACPWVCMRDSTHGILNAERDAQSDVVVQLESLLSTQGFLKRVLASKSPHVRTAAYTLIAHLCYRCAPVKPHNLCSKVLPASAEWLLTTQMASWHAVTELHVIQKS